MVAWGEVAVLLLLGAIGVRWYLRTRLHRARKRSAVGAPQSRLTFAARDLPRPTPPPRALHDQAHLLRGRSSLDEPLDS